MKMFTSVFTSLSYQISVSSQQNESTPTCWPRMRNCLLGGESDLKLRPETLLHRRDTFTVIFFFQNKCKHVYLCINVNLIYIFCDKNKNCAGRKKNNNPQRHVGFSLFYYWGRGLRPEARRCSFLWHGEFIPPGEPEDTPLMFFWLGVYFKPAITCWGKQKAETKLTSRIQLPVDSDSMLEGSSR